MIMDFTVNLSHFNTNNVIDMSNMFDEYKLLNELNLTNFNTTKLLIWAICSMDVHH